MFKSVIIKDLEKENQKIKREDKSLRYELEDYEFEKRNRDSFFRKIQTELFNIQDIDTTGVSEKDKRMKRNNIINKLINDITKELSTDTTR